MILLSKDYGLPPRTVLEQLDDDIFAIVVDRKSRIVMADGRKILDKCEKIRQVNSAAKVVLKTSAPVCSKTLKLLESSGVSVIPVSDAG